MKIRKSDIKALQTVLTEDGLYKKKIDGLSGPGTRKAIDNKLCAHLNEIPFDPFVLSNNRRLNLALQITCKENEFDPGPLDGYYGPQTQNAATLLHRKYFGDSVPHFDDLVLIDVNPNSFPDSKIVSLSNHYGQLKANCKGLEHRIKKVPCPWKMRLDWDLSKKRSFFKVHELVADSLERVVNNVFDHYGLAEIQRLGLDRFSGDYVPRKMRGGSKCSTHAWGIAIDFFGSKNELKRSTADIPPPTLAQAELNFWWETWEKEGWYSLGRMEDRDWMHVQAAKGSRSNFYHA